MSLSSWDRLNQERAYIAERSRSSIARSIQSAANALMELVTASPATGGQQVFLFPHDHGRRGGVPLSRGMTWCFAGPNSDAYPIYATNTHWVNRNAGTYLDRDFAFWPDVPWGLDSNNGKTAISGQPCYLEAKVRVHLPSAAGNTKVDVSFVNESIVATGMSPTTLPASAVSDVQSATVFSGVNLLTFTKIPIIQDQRNTLGLWFKSDVGAIIVEVLTCIIASTRTATQPDSLGTFNIQANPKP